MSEQIKKAKNIIRETVKTYAGFIKVVETFAEFPDSVIEMKQIYFVGLRVYEKSKFREKTFSDGIRKALGIWDGQYFSQRSKKYAHRTIET